MSKPKPTEEDTRIIHSNLVGNPKYISVGVATNELIIYMTSIKHVKFDFLKDVKCEIRVVAMGKVIPVSEIQMQAIEYRCKKCNSDDQAIKVAETLAFIKKKGFKSAADPVVGQCLCGHVMPASDFDDLENVPLKY